MSQEYRVPIKEWAPEDRPREKLMSLGAAALSDAELLSVLIGGGTAECSALDIGHRLLLSVDGSLAELGRVELSALRLFKGIGLARGVTIAAALELGRRRGASEATPQDSISGSRDLVGIFRPLLCELPYEEVWVVLLSRSKRIIEKFRLSMGSSAASVIDPRPIVRRALERNAAGIVLVHNHPSGSVTPSDDDLYSTSKVRLAASYFDIRLLDHLIITDGGEAFSFAENNLL